MPLLKLDNSYIDLSDRYVDNVLESGNIRSFVYRMDFWPLVLANNVTTTRTGITPRAAKITLPEIDGPDYSLVYVLISFPNGDDVDKHENEGDTVILSCPSGDIRDIDGKVLDFFEGKVKLKEALYPYRDKSNSSTEKLPEKIERVLEGKEGTYKNLTAKEIISKADSLDIQETTRYPSRSFLYKKFKDEGINPMPDLVDFVRIYGTIRNNQ